MGMFDTLTVRKSFIRYLKLHKLAKKEVIDALDPREGYQSKDLECLLDVYEFRWGGLYKDERKYYEVPEEERPFPHHEIPFMRLCGMLGSKHTGWTRIRTTTTIRFYDGDKDFEAEMFRGKITRVILLPPFDYKKAAEEIDKAIEENKLQNQPK